MEQHFFNERLKTYITGFFLSILLTLASFFIALQYTNGGGITKNAVIISIVVLAVSQFIIQTIFFLHLGDEKRPRWNLISFLSMLSIVLILVFGSIWIMYSLEYNMSPEETEKTIIEDELINRL